MQMSGFNIEREYKQCKELLEHKNKSKEKEEIEECRIFILFRDINSFT